MSKDRLFLLRPLFPDPKVSDALFHCASCAQVEGLLGYFPFLRGTLEVSYQAFPRPRQAIVDLLGEAHQSCPVLVLAEDSPSTHPAIRTSEASGRRFVSGAADISAYLAASYHISSTHP